MRNPWTILFNNRSVSTDSRTVTALQEYVDALIKVLSENCRNHSTPQQADVEAVTPLADISIVLRTNVSFTLHSTGRIARSYYNALGRIILPVGVTLTQPRYRREISALGTLDCHKLLHNIKRNMLTQD